MERLASPGRTAASYWRIGSPSLRQLSTMEKIAATLGPASLLPRRTQFFRPITHSHDPSVPGGAADVEARIVPQDHALPIDRKAVCILSNHRVDDDRIGNQRPGDDALWRGPRSLSACTSSLLTPGSSSSNSNCKSLSVSLALPYLVMRARRRCSSRTWIFNCA